MRVRLILFFCLLSLPALGQNRLTLDDAVARALANSFDIRISDVTVQQANANNTLGNAGFLPNINGTAGVSTGLTNAHIEFADGRIQEANGAGTVNYTAGIAADYVIFAAGRAYLVRKQLRASEDLARTQLKEQMQNVVSQTIQTYARVVLQQQQSIAIDTALALAKTRMVLSQIKFETGASAKVDYLQARVDYNSRQSDSLQQIASLNSAFADLNYLMGADPFLDYIVDDSLQLDLSLVPSDKNNLRDMNLSIAAAKQNQEVYDLNAKISRTYLFPQLGATAGLNYSRSQSGSGTTTFSRSYGPTGGLNVTVPIFQGGNLRRQVKVASLEAFRYQLLYERQNTDISRQYRSAWKNYEMSVAAYRLEEENIRYAKENLDIQIARFRVGIATTLEAREAENGYIAALVRLYTAAYNVKLNETTVLALESSLVK